VGPGAQFGARLLGPVIPLCLLSVVGWVGLGCWVGGERWWEKEARLEERERLGTAGFGVGGEQSRRGKGEGIAQTRRGGR